MIELSGEVVRRGIEKRHSRVTTRHIKHDGIRTFCGSTEHFGSGLQELKTVPIVQTGEVQAG